MKRLLYVFASLIALSITTSCENDIDINAPWRETPVVYAFLEPNIDTQYFRIQKTYQNSIDLTSEQGAKINDSLYFDNIIVRVKSSTQTAVFTKTTDIPKETGYFSNGTHYLYKGALKPQAGKTYSLEIFSPKTGNTYLSTTTALGTSNLIDIFFQFHDPRARVSFTVSQIAGANDVKPTLRFKYIEYPNGIPNTNTINIDYVVDEPYVQSGPNLVYRINNRVLVNYIKDAIPVKAGYTRQIVGFDLFYIGAGKEIVDLINIMKPSAMVVQKKLEYTNISGGLGIFSSRSVNFDADIQNDPESNWNSATGKEAMVGLLNADPKDLNFIP